MHFMRSAESENLGACGPAKYAELPARLCIGACHESSMSCPGFRFPSTTVAGPSLDFLGSMVEHGGTNEV
jgi:hypothetical protein